MWNPQETVWRTPLMTQRTNRYKVVIVKMKQVSSSDHLGLTQRSEYMYK